MKKCSSSTSKSAETICLNTELFHVITEELGSRMHSLNYDFFDRVIGYDFPSSESSARDSDEMMTAAFH